MLTMYISRIVPTLAVVATVGILSAAARPDHNVPPRNLPSPLMDETWPAPDAVLKSGSLSFTGHSTVGDFVGTTTSASGGVIGNANLANARGWVEATVSSLSTGNRLRDRDLRSTMDVATYPAMRFELAGVTVESPAATSDTVTGALRGTLTIHGVTRDVVVPATLVATADTVDASGSFPIDLGDYKVGGLTRLFGTLRVRREIEVRFRVRFEPAPHTRS
jgi:polyisoprenoid-binding protein YceI